MTVNDGHLWGLAPYTLIMGREESLFIYSFNKYLFSVSSVPGTVPDTTGSKISPCLCGLYVLVGAKVRICMRLKKLCKPQKFNNYLLSVYTMCK